MTRQSNCLLATSDWAGSKSHLLVRNRLPWWVVCRTVLRSCGDFLISNQIRSCSYPMNGMEGENPAMLPCYQSVEARFTCTGKISKFLPRSSRCPSFLSKAFYLLHSCHYQRNGNRSKKREVDGDFVFIREVNLSNHGAVKESPFCLCLCGPCTF